jgi:hypothetical protein
MVAVPLCSVKVGSEFISAPGEVILTISISTSIIYSIFPRFNLASRDLVWNGKPAPSRCLHRQLDVTPHQRVYALDIRQANPEPGSAAHFHESSALSALDLGLTGSCLGK